MAWLGYWDMTLPVYAMGLPDRELVGHEDSLTIGANNRAWLLDVNNTDSVEWAYYHEFVGGSLEYNVDLH